MCVSQTYASFFALELFDFQLLMMFANPVCPGCPGASDLLVNPFAAPQGLAGALSGWCSGQGAAKPDRALGCEWAKCPSPRPAQKDEFVYFCEARGKGRIHMLNASGCKGTGGGQGSAKLTPTGQGYPEFSFRCWPLGNTNQLINIKTRQVCKFGCVR